MFVTSLRQLLEFATEQIQWLKSIAQQLQGLQQLEIVINDTVQKNAARLEEIDRKLNVILKATAPAPAVALRIIWAPQPKPQPSPNQRNYLFKENLMPATLNPGKAVKFTVAPVNAQGAPSNATLSGISFSSSDAAVFTVAADPDVTNGGIVTALTPPITPDAAVLTANATATEPDGVTTEAISGSDTVTVVIKEPPPPPPPVATGLAFTFGTPF